MAVLLLGSTQFLLHSRETARAAIFRRESSAATGAITRVRSGRHTDMVLCAFAANGINFTGEWYATTGHGAGLREGDTLPIRFLPSNPAINHPAAWEGPGSTWFVPYLYGAILSAIGITLVSQFRRDRQLLAEGVATAGVITEGHRRGKYGYHTKYQFRTKDGRLVEGSGYRRKRSERGATVCVLYLSQDPQRNAPYPVRMYRLAQ